MPLDIIGCSGDGIVGDDDEDDEDGGMCEAVMVTIMPWEGVGPTVTVRIIIMVHTDM